MNTHLMILLLLTAVAQGTAQCQGSKPIEEPKIVTTQNNEYKDLPDGAKPDDEVRVSKGDGHEVISVKEMLDRLGARYKDGVLVDKEGIEIRFFKPGIRGASEGFEADRRFNEAEQKRLADLKKQFTVIEIWVNPLKIM